MHMYAVMPMTSACRRIYDIGPQFFSAASGEGFGNSTIPPPKCPFTHGLDTANPSRRHKITQNCCQTHSLEPR